jgi:alkylhydroperoxidase/carboxymuconolactone decarboxylase family protein YurZ
MTFEHRDRRAVLAGGTIPAKYTLLMAMLAAGPDSAEALAVDARAAGASEAEIAEAVQIGRFFGGARAPAAAASPRPRRTTAGAKLRSRIALWAAALLVAAGLLVQRAPASWADVCGDVGAAPVSGCTQPGGPAGDPPAPQGASQPSWLGAIQRRDPQFGDSYMAMRERILRDGAIPAKYKLLMAMVTDAIAAHPDGVRTLADNARAAGATEPEVTEAVEVGYLFGGTAALVMGSNALG